MEELHRRTPRTEAFWHAYAAASGIRGGYDVVALGDAPEMADSLAELVLSGTKRATAGLLRDLGENPVPKAGDHAVMVDGAGEPRAIWRTAEVRVGPLSSVDAAFAWDEGEGDRTRTGWLRMHEAFFRRQAEREGFAFRDDIETVFERFEVVWPRQRADTR
ncbi:uncharacterized protein YhfF [Hasllibacter halocynthiae]|uniref:Uncharacterized protein YhfF n=1 Tax=Hasllibacter halocynthiae TaxID=595589 RepID=A0A2T0X867_9RHOB|nr:ASCH domain-containing protein [Hasllibacter halocynthiae]PRY95140.1 uncharacterized protein YhfF [Hasllibacter halocynthiae]